MAVAPPKETERPDESAVTLPSRRTTSTSSPAGRIATPAAWPSASLTTAVPEANHTLPTSVRAMTSSSSPASRPTMRCPSSVSRTTPLRGASQAVRASIPPGAAVAQVAPATTRGSPVDHSPRSSGAVTKGAVTTSPLRPTRAREPSASTTVNVWQSADATGWLMAAAGKRMTDALWSMMARALTPPWVAPNATVGAARCPHMVGAMRPTSMSTMASSTAMPR